MQNKYFNIITEKSPTLLFIASILLILQLAACGSTSEDEDDHSEDRSAEELYLDAKSAMRDDNFENAIDFFEKLEVKYPYGPFAKQAKLEIIYAYYEYEQLESAIIAAERFIKLYPKHSHVDYAYYMRGVSQYNMEESFFESLFNQDLTQRDPESAKKAFQHFSLLIKKFPKSIYNADANKRMLFLRNNLAKYEIHVANYYIQRKAYVAAVNRAKYVLNNYQKTSSIPDALAIMVDAYTVLKLPKLAADAQRVLTATQQNIQTNSNDIDTKTKSKNL